MPFIASYTTSYKARHSRATDAWTPDGGVYRATSGLSFWIDASDTSSYTTNTSGITSVTDKAGSNAITINHSGNVNDFQPQAHTNQNGVPSSMPVFEFSGESFTTGDFAQVDSDGNHFSIALVRAGNDITGNPFGSYFGSFWSLENNDSGILASGIRRDYGIELGDGTYFYGQLALDSRPTGTGHAINNDEVVQYEGTWSNTSVNTDQNLLRFDNYGNSQNLRDSGEWFIMAIVFNKTGNEILVRIDGENMFTPVPYDAKLNTEMSVRIAVNRLYDKNDTTLHCQVAEFMTFAAPPGTGGTDISEVERLEGYLAHKWANQSLLPTTHPYRNYSLASTGDWNPSQGFPTDSGNMDTAFWIDGSDSDSYTFNTANGYVESITDKSGNSTLSMDDNTQIWRGSIGGKYVMMFQGNTGISTTSTSVQASNGNHWAIGLMRYNNIDSSEDSFWQLNSTDGTNRDYAVESRNSYTSAGWAGQTDLSTSDISSGVVGDINWTTGVSHQFWSIIAVYFNKTGDQIGARLNGTDAHTPVNNYDNAISTNQEVHLFKSRQGNFLNGDIAEFFTFADIPGTGGTDVSFIEIAEGYLAHKWSHSGLGGDFVGNLPSDHPFKNSAP